MKNYFKQPITSEEQSKKFFHKLYLDNLLFHPEDDPRIVMTYNRKTKVEKQLFNSEECEYLDQRLKEIYTYMEDPCGFILESTSLWSDHYDYLEKNNLTYTL